MIKEMNLTPKQEKTLKNASYKIADAYYMLLSLKNEMKTEKKWIGYDDICTVVKNLNELVGTHAGGIGTFLKEL
jgi:hypothetical protein